jgi:NADH:ubiquinone oxidoreductase subunit 5 (subunit L)/multisubunit Na+/H+ antiporter MnhA subunit
MSVVGIVLLALIVIGGAAALFFFLRGIMVRSTQSSKPYSVARQEARHEMQVNFLRGGFLLIVAVILLGIYGLTPGQEPASEQGSATPTRPAETTAEVAPVETGTPVQTASRTITRAAIEQATAVMTVTLTPTATATVTTTETPPPITAVVNSPNGLWLREAPGGTQQLELIAHDSTLTLLPGRETADDLEWQQVRTAAGNEGWVAAEFLIYQN